MILFQYVKLLGRGSSDVEEVFLIFLYSCRLYGYCDHKSEGPTIAFFSINRNSHYNTKLIINHVVPFTNDWYVSAEAEAIITTQTNNLGVCASTYGECKYSIERKSVELDVRGC